MTKVKFLSAVLIALFHLSSASTGLGPPIQSSEDEATRRRFIEYSLPLIVLEKHHGHNYNTPRFRIEIFANGLGRFAGLRDTKRLGEVEFGLTAEQIKRVQEALEKAEFWNLPQIPSFIGARSIGDLVLEVYARKENLEKRVYLTWGSPATSTIYIAIEKEVNSKQWRCPFVTLTFPKEYCDQVDQDFQRAADSHLLPKKVPK